MPNFASAKAKTSRVGRPERDAKPNPDLLPPQFSFEYMETKGYSVTCCNDEHRAALATRMFKLTEMTWSEIVNTQRHGLGSEKIYRTSLKAKLPARVSEDATLLAIRYMGLCPMIGFRDGRVFNVVFIDHKMDAYKH